MLFNGNFCKISSIRISSNGIGCSTTFLRVTNGIISLGILPMLYLLCSELYPPPKGRRSGTTGGSASDAKDQELEVDRLHTLHSVVNSCIQLVPSSMRCITPIPPRYWCSLQPTICPFLKLIKFERQMQRLHWYYRFYQKLFYFCRLHLPF